MRSRTSSVPEPVSSPGNGTWPLGGHPGTSEGLCHTPLSCSWGTCGVRHCHPREPKQQSRPLQQPRTGAGGLKRSA